MCLQVIDVVNPYRLRIKWWWRFEASLLSIRLHWKIIISIGLDLLTFATVITPFGQYFPLQFKNDTTIQYNTSWRHRIRKPCIRITMTAPSALFSNLLPESCSKKLGFLFHLILEKITNALKFVTQFRHAEKTTINPQAYFYISGKSNRNAPARLHIRSLLPSERGFFAKLI